MRKTKIVATIGPSCMDYGIFKKMVQAGLNIVRINLSHADEKCLEAVYKNVVQAREEFKVPLPIMLDTKGPELRVKTFANGSVNIKRGQKFVFTGRNVQGNTNEVSLNMPKLVECINVGDKILAVNGLLSFKVVDKKGKDVITKAENSGLLSNRKSLSVPGLVFNTPYLNSADKADILWGIKHDVEFVAASFVNSKKDVLDLKNFITKNGGNMKIISKIESKKGVENLAEIVEVSDGLMVARGDLGVELNMEKLPQIQKDMIVLARKSGKPVITATEMLESMIKSKRPTRAEVSDVANAVYDGTSAIMLSGESASGAYPVEAVKTMHNIALETEKNLEYADRFNAFDCPLLNSTDVICRAAVDASFKSDVKAVVAFTNSGLTANMVSRFCPGVDILGVTPNEKTYRQLELTWGVKPMLTPVYNSTDEMFNIANKLVKSEHVAKVGENIIIACGTPKQDGCTNLIKITKIN